MFHSPHMIELSGFGQKVSRTYFHAYNLFRFGGGFDILSVGFEKTTKALKIILFLDETFKTVCFMWGFW
jgi:hypothetical protein